MTFSEALKEGDTDSSCFEPHDSYARGGGPQGCLFAEWQLLWQVAQGKGKGRDGLRWGAGKCMSGSEALEAGDEEGYWGGRRFGEGEFWGCVIHAPCKSMNFRDHTMVVIVSSRTPREELYVWLT